MAKIKEGFAGKIPGTSDSTKMDFFVCPNCGHNKTGLRIGQNNVGMEFTFQAFAECYNCGHVFPAPTRRTNLDSARNETSYIGFQIRVSEKLERVESTRPQRRRLEKAIEADRDPEILAAAYEIGPEVKDSVLESKRLGWGKRGLRFIVRYLKLGAALAFTASVTAGFVYITNEVLNALDADVAIEEIVDDLLENPEHNADQDPEDRSGSIDEKEETNRPKVFIGKPTGE